MATKKLSKVSTAKSVEAYGQIWDWLNRNYKCNCGVCGGGNSAYVQGMRLNMQHTRKAGN